MSDAPDPLGKRALFWAPAERHEEGPRYPDDNDAPGRHALFSDPRTAPSPPRGRGRARPSAPSVGGRGKAGHPSNRRPPAEGRASAAGAGHDDFRSLGPDELERPAGSGMFGSLALHCSSCRARSHVDVVEFVVLHLPLWFWRPGRGYTRFMTCPACRRRTWVSASWTSWSR